MLKQLESTASFKVGEFFTQIKETFKDNLCPSFTGSGLRIYFW
jgi:hypothetical protein